MYFFDEFDAIASQRGMTNDVGEIRRILNSFLLMIEQDESNSVIVAATNHVGILDEALFRRFDDMVEYQVPSADEIRALLRMRLGSYLKSTRSIATLATDAIGLSHAEITRAVGDAVKEAVMHDQDSVPAEAVKPGCSNDRQCAVARQSPGPRHRRGMATGQPQHRPHLFPRDTRSTEGYTAKPQARDPEPGVPEKDRPQHAGALRAQLAQVVIAQQPRVAELQAANVRSAIGIKLNSKANRTSRSPLQALHANDRASN